MPGSSASEWKFMLLGREFSSHKPVGISADLLYFYFIIIQASIWKKLTPRQLLSLSFVIQNFHISRISHYIKP